MGTIIVAVLGSNVILEIVKWVLKKIDKKKQDPIADLKKQLDEARTERKKNEQEHEQAMLRIQMLILMNHYPNESYQLMECAKKYFVDCKGDWWMSGMFEDHCKENGVSLPQWFKSERR